MNGRYAFCFLNAAIYYSCRICTFSGKITCDPIVTCEITRTYVHYIGTTTNILKFSRAYSALAKQGLRINADLERRHNSPTLIGCFIAWVQFSTFWTWVGCRSSVWRDFWDAWSISPLTPSATRWRHPLANPFPCPSGAGRASPERLFSRKLRH